MNTQRNNTPQGMVLERDKDPRHPPFQHHNAGALLMAHMVQPPPDPRDLVHDLASETASAIQRAMAKTPQERFATVGEFVSALA